MFGSTATKSGALDAAEFSLPAMDQPLGFQSEAKFYYFPGWHQQATFFDLYVNKRVWDGLPEKHQAIIEIACGDAIREMISVDKPVIFDCVVDPAENCFPMIPSGRAHHEMLLGDSAVSIDDAVTEEGKIMV